ncbi:hypothetical protein ES705_47548 [subsurface metagenome]
MTKKIDEVQFLKDFYEGKLYSEIALSHKCSKGTVSYRLGKLGLKRRKQLQELFSAEEKDILRDLIGTYRGRKQLLYILRGK